MIVDVCNLLFPLRHTFSFPGSCLGMPILRALPGLYPKIPPIPPFSKGGIHGPEPGWIIIFICDRPIVGGVKRPAKGDDRDTCWCECLHTSHWP